MQRIYRAYVTELILSSKRKGMAVEEMWYWRDERLHFIIDTLFEKL